MNIETTATASTDLKPEILPVDTNYFIDDDYQPFGSFKSMLELNNWFRFQAQVQLMNSSN